VVYKPSLGGGPCLPLNAEARARLDGIASSPVTLQERIAGAAVRATFVDGACASCVEIPSTELDYRCDPAYREGRLDYLPCVLPDAVLRACSGLLERCALIVAGIDLLRASDGTWFFLEANPSPTYLDIERRAGHPITRSVADALLRRLDAALGQRPERQQPFVRYVYPFDPERGVGGPAD
jgi:hypothetical protein